VDKHLLYRLINPRDAAVNPLINHLKANPLRDADAESPEKPRKDVLPAAEGAPHENDHEENAQSGASQNVKCPGTASAFWLHKNYISGEFMELQVL
jgi:hypothetical protein